MRYIAILFVLCSTSFAEEIPLSEVWSYDRARQELEPELFIKLNTPEKRAEYSTPEKQQEVIDRAHSSLTWQIEQAMNNDALDLNSAHYPGNRQPAQCFAVGGSKHEAWKGVHNAIVENQTPKAEFSSKDKISLVFFSLMSNPLPSLKRIEREDFKIKLGYILPTESRGI